MIRHIHKYTFYALLFLLTSCSNLHLHNESRAATAAEAEEATAKLNIDSVLEERRNAQLAITTLDIEMIEQISAVHKDTLITLIALSEDKLSKAWYIQEFVPELNKLVGLESFTEAVIRQQNNVEKSKKRLQYYEGTRKYIFKETACPTKGSLRNPWTGDVLREKLLDTLTPTNEEIELYEQSDNEYIQICATYRKQVATEWGQEHADLNKLLQQIRSLKNEKSEAKQLGKDIKAEFDTLSKLVPVTTEKKLPSEVIKNGQEKINELLDKVKGTAADYSKLSVIEARLDKLSEVIGILGSDFESNSQGTNLVNRKLQVALSGFPSLLDKVATLQEKDKSLTRADVTLLQSGLLARKAEILARINNYDRKIAVAQKYYDDLQSMFFGYHRVEGFLKNACRAFLKGKGKPHGNCDYKLNNELGDLTYHELQIFKGKNPAEIKRARYLMDQALCTFALIQKDADIARAKYQKSTQYLKHDLSVTRAQKHVASWMAMITPLVKQTNSYESGGIKVGNTANFAVEVAKVLGLFAIADGS